MPKPNDFSPVGRWGLIWNFVSILNLDIWCRWVLSLTFRPIYTLRKVCWPPEVVMMWWREETFLTLSRFESRSFIDWSGSAHGWVEVSFTTALHGAERLASSSGCFSLAVSTIWESAWYLFANIKCCLCLSYERQLFSQQLVFWLLFELLLMYA